jgi:hypothetical protein
MLFRWHQLWLVREEGRLYSDVLVQQGPPARTVKTKSSRSSKVVFETGQPRGMSQSVTTSETSLTQRALGGRFSKISGSRSE